MKEANEIRAWISLLKVPGVGSKTFQRLLDAFGSPSSVFAANTETIKQAGFTQRIASNIQDFSSLELAQADIDWLNAAEDHYIITLACDAYPKLLKQIDNPPPLLYVHGNLAILNDPQIAIIGSRNPTQSGISAAYDFAKHLTQTGLCVTSGLALGIDGKAHQGALDANGPTIAVIATGIDRVYPAKHRELAHQIVMKGAIVSEFAIGTQPKGENFPRRNRIISGLSYGTLVVEAALKSGSLITARLAMEQNREVFAIPGSIHNPLARGCHQLIRQGVKLVETAQDILEEMVVDLELAVKEVDSKDLPKPEEKERESVIASVDKEEKVLLDSMGFDPVPIDQLVVRTGFSPESISSMLLMLELNDRVSSNGGGTYTRLN